MLILEFSNSPLFNIFKLNEMKKWLLMLSFIAFALVVNAQESDEDFAKRIDSIEHSFEYQDGTIELKNGLGTLVVPKGYKYLNPTQAERVLVDLWGNPKSSSPSYGMLVPENMGLLDSNSFVFNIEYEEIGYVEDDDASDINYSDLLKQLQEESVEENKIRKEGGFGAIQIVGWASTPFYDEKRKILHWAKELKFEGQSSNTLNYNIRILGRKGVIVLNAIATMRELPLVKRDLESVMAALSFSKGNRYEDFDSGTDEVAAWTIGGLVAGKILAKTGFLAVLLKFWKIIAVVVLGGASALWKRFRKKKEESEALAVNPGAESEQ